MTLTAYTKSTPYSRGGFNTYAQSGSAYPNPISSKGWYEVGGLGGYLSGFRQSDYKVRLRQHLDATTTMNATRKTVKFDEPLKTVCQVNFLDGTKSIEEVEGICYFPNVHGGLAFTHDAGVSPKLDHVENMAKSKFFQRYINTVREFQGLTFLGELRETLHMIRRPALALREEVNRLISMVDRLRFARGHARALSNTWLEWSFGVKPLVKDVQTGVAALTNFPLNQFSSVSAKVSDSYRIIPVETPQAYSQGNYVRWDTSLYGDVTKGVKIVGEVLRSTPSAFHDAASKYGLDARNILPAAYELMPWSFLIDYFTNLGELVDSWSDHYVSLQWSSTTTRVTTRRFKEFRAKSYIVVPGIEANQFGLSKVAYEYKTVDRTSALPMPTFGMSTGLTSLTRGLNLSALLVSTSKLRRF